MISVHTGGLKNYMVVRGLCVTLGCFRLTLGRHINTKRWVFAGSLFFNHTAVTWRFG